MNNKKKENKVSSNETSKELKKQLKSLLLSKNFETSEGMGTGGSGTGGSGSCSCSYNINNAPFLTYEDISWTVNGYVNCNATVMHNKITIDSIVFSVTISGNSTTQSVDGGGKISKSGNTVIFSTYGSGPSQSESPAKAEASENSITFTVSTIETDTYGKEESSSEQSTSGNVDFSCSVEINDLFNELEITDVKIEFLKTY